MKTSVLVIRVSPAMKAAIRRAAEMDSRTVASLVTHLLVRHCQERGIQVETGKPRRRR